MIWPPVKAWTSNKYIEGQRHFVAINYGGKLQDRWVVFMSVLDSNVLFKVAWSELVDSCNWKCGWDENNQSDFSHLVNSKFEKVATNFTELSVDSGLTIPITKKKIRAWFVNI